jgi:hypothetical protein
MGTIHRHHHTHEIVSFGLFSFMQSNMLVIGILISVSLAIYLYIVFRQPGLPTVFLRNDRGAQEKTNVLLVTAHPDDECMFFAPTLLQLARQPEVVVHLLCVTKGKQSY